MMGNGTKMRGALDRAGNPHTIDSLQTDHDAGIYLPLLFCADLACKATVRFGPRSQQNRKNLVQPVSVSAVIMFGLWEAKGAVENVGKRISESKHSATFVTRKLILRPKFKKQLHKAF